MNSQRIKSFDVYPRLDNKLIEGKKCEFMLPSYGQIKAMFLLFDVTAPGPAVPSTSPSSFLFIGNAELLCNNTFVIAQANDISSLSRLDTMNVTEHDYLLKYANPSGGGFTTTTKTISFPLFYWVVDGQMINTDVYNLSVRLAIKNTLAGMGVEGTLNELNVRMRVEYDNTHPVDLDLSKSYNSFYLTPQVVLNGSTNSRVYINLPYKVYSLAFSVRKNTNYQSSLITKVILKFPNGAEETYDQLSNYYIGTKLADNAETFTITINDKFKDAYQVSNRPYQPVIATVFYENPGTDSILCTTYDYFSTITEHSDPSLSNKFLVEENNIYY
jgi:hypothetical protein